MKINPIQSKYNQQPQNQNFGIRFKPGNKILTRTAFAETKAIPDIVDLSRQLEGKTPIVRFLTGVYALLKAQGDPRQAGNVLAVLAERLEPRHLDRIKVPVALQKEPLLLSHAVLKVRQRPDAEGVFQAWQRLAGGKLDSIRHINDVGV